MITTIEYGTSTFGANNGKVGYILASDDRQCTDDNILEVRLKVRQDPGRSKNIELTGQYSTMDSALHTLVYALKGDGFSVQAVISGQVAYTWLMFADWTVVEMDKSTRDWPAFPVNELRYWLTEPDEDEPVLPEIIPALYLVPGQGMTTDHILGFYERAKHLWTISTPMKKYRRLLWTG